MEELLIVEDDVLLKEGISYALRREGYLVYEAGSLKEARQALKNRVKLVILDLNLPDGDGRELLSQLRAGVDLPVLVLTARDSEEDVVESFDLGCDDYMTKPFSTAILLKHVKAVLRRTRGQERDVYYHENLIYNFSCKELRNRGQTVNLTATECRLLEAFLQNPNQVLTRELLLEKVWDAYENYVDEKTLNVNVRRLREKVEEDPRHPVYIVTVFGIGYKWSENHD